MKEKTYLEWLTSETQTSWWHDSADPDELRQGLNQGASGVTTNPFLVYKTLSSTPEKWAASLREIPRNLSAEERAEQLMRAVICKTAETLRPRYDRSAGGSGYVCAQVSPLQAADAEYMLQMGARFQQWAPNVVVKLPATAAGLDALEECATRGINVAATVSFTVPQVIAVAERYRQGSARARKAGLPAGRCLAVIMIGRLDDYLRDVAKDRRASADESDIRQAGLAVVKRAISVFEDRGYEAALLIAALRGVYHMDGLAGAKLIMSIAPNCQAMLLQPGVARDMRPVNRPILPAVLDRLHAIPDFVRAYEPDGMKPEEFISFGLTQRTLSQFIEAGWSPLQSLKLP
jgi:transaldolase